MGFDFNLLDLEINIPSTDIKDYTILVSGKPKIGKSTLVKKIKGSFAIDLDRGTKSLVMRRHQFNSWEEILDASKQLVQAKKYLRKAEEAKENSEEQVEIKIGKKKITLPVDEAIKKLSVVKVVSIDTVNQALTYIKEYLVRQENTKRIEKNKETISTFNEVGWDKNDQVQQEMMKVVNDLRDNGYGVILVSHVKDKKNNKGTEQEYIEIVPDLQDVERNWLIGAADIYLQIDEENETIEKAKFKGDKLISPAIVKNKRYIYLRGNETREAGIRFKYVPERIEFEEDSGFANLEEVFEIAVHKEIEEGMKEFDLDENQVDKLKQQQIEVKEQTIEESIKDFSEQEKKEEIPEIIKEIKNKIKSLKVTVPVPKISEAWISLEIKDPTKVTDIEEAKKVLKNLNNIE